HLPPLHPPPFPTRRSSDLFIFTPDEGDHFVGSTPSNPGCDGVTTPCTYTNVGELDINLNALVTNAGDSTPFSEHSDSAPTECSRSEEHTSELQSLTNLVCR